MKRPLITFFFNFARDDYELLLKYFRALISARDARYTGESWRYARDARDARCIGSKRAARQLSGEGREAGEAV